MFKYFVNINFLNPEVFFLLLLLPLAGFWYYRTYRRRYPSLRLPTLPFLGEGTSWRGRLRVLLPLLRALAFIALVTALARPQLTLKEEEIMAEAVDIALVMDLSSRMSFTVLLQILAISRYRFRTPASRV